MALWSATGQLLAGTRSRALCGQKSSKLMAKEFAPESESAFNLK